MRLKCCGRPRVRAESALAGAEDAAHAPAAPLHRVREAPAAGEAHRDTDGGERPLHLRQGLLARVHRECGPTFTSITFRHMRTYCAYTAYSPRSGWKRVVCEIKQKRLCTVAINSNCSIYHYLLINSDKQLIKSQYTMYRKCQIKYKKIYANYASYRIVDDSKSIFRFILVDVSG